MTRLCPLVSLGQKRNPQGEIILSVTKKMFEEGHAMNEMKARRKHERNQRPCPEVGKENKDRVVRKAFMCDLPQAPSKIFRQREWNVRDKVRSRSVVVQQGIT